MKKPIKKKDFMKILTEKIRAGTHSALKIESYGDYSPELATMLSARDQLRAEESQAEEMFQKRYFQSS